MIYARRFGAFVPFLFAAVITPTVTYLVKPRLETWLPNHWQIAVVLSFIGGGITIYFVAYSVNLALICGAGRRQNSTRN